MTKEHNFQAGNGGSPYSFQAGDGGCSRRNRFTFDVDSAEIVDDSKPLNSPSTPCNTI